MGAGASAIQAAKGADSAAILTGVQGLNAKDKAILAAALEASASGDSKTIAENVKNIAENEANIHKLGLSVQTNKQGVFEARSMIEANRASILQNYADATTGNRQMCIENTDSIFRNRAAILDALKVDGPVQENFRNTKYNESNIEYLQNQCLANNRVAKVNVKIQEANADLIAANDLIIKSNDEIVAFNAAQIETNKKLLAGIQADKATPEANAARVASNKENIAKIKERNDKYNAEMGNIHAAIKENRKNIDANAAAIKERRKLILENRKTITENGEKVAELLQGGTVNIEEVAATLGSLSDDEKASIKKALEAGCEVSETIAANRKNITENEAKLHQLYLDVMTNKSKLQAVRSIMEENRALLFKNYAAAFSGSRLLINQNTDDIFKNRVAILDAMKVDGQVQENFRNTKYNEANINFLEHRSLLNNRVAKTNAAMSAANAKLIEINSMVMNNSEEIVKFNTSAIETNKKLMEGVMPEKCTPEANAKRVEENSKGIQVIVDHMAKYDEKVTEIMNKTLENRKLIIANSKTLDELRKKMKENRMGILENGKIICEQIRS
jgi:hypothetical protein